MNKNALLDYALFARRELETQIALSLNNLGITKDGVANIKRVGDVYAIDGIQDSISQRVYELRKRIIDAHINNAKFEDVVEEFAYTWFNRIVAIRFMEVHDYYPHGFRVLSSRDGSYEPEILKNLPFVAAELKLDEKRVTTYQEQNRLEDLYRYVLVQQCNALKDIIPMLFEEQGAYLELLLPSNLLSQDSIIRRIEDVPEEDFLNDIEIVGWLYQFYNSVKKDEVFASKKKITKETLPAVTQLFTPDWIVRYMAENSIGRIWMESYPSSPMKSEMKYYVDDVEQTEEVQKRIDEIKYKNVKPEDIRIIEPCCGSGHILVYAFDLLNQMYIEKGYEKREIPGLILKNNLYGLDVDKRAAQLAQFALIMKARSIDNRFFNDGRYVLPKVYEIFDSQSIENDYREHMKTLKFSKESIDTAYYLVKTFKDGKIIGSLLKVEEREYTTFIEELEKVKSGDIPGLFELMFFNYGLDILKQLAELAIVLSQKYDVMITNPPYMSSDKMSDAAKSYLEEYYPEGRYDYFASFIQRKRDLVIKDGFASLITMHNYMYAVCYESLRNELQHDGTFISMLHLGTRAFTEIGGEVVQTCAYSIRNSILKGYTTPIIDVTEANGDEKIKEFGNPSNRYQFSFERCEDLPLGAMVYSMPEKLFEMYCVPENALSNYAEPKAGVVTGKDTYFLRYWYEPCFDEIELGEKNPYGKYHLFSKGGSFSRWYGNVMYAIKLADLYDSTKTNVSVRRGDPDYYFKKGIGWSYMGDGNKKKFSIIKDCVCGTSTPTIYLNNGRYFNYVLGFLNTKITPLLVRLLNPTLSTYVGDIIGLPLSLNEDAEKEVNEIVEQSINIAKDDWCSIETSFEFTRHPLVRIAEEHRGKSIKQDYEQWKNDCVHNIEVEKKNEQRLNEIFIALYGLSGELSSTVEESEITLHQPDIKADMRSYVSYIIGLILGRYSLDHEGVVNAGVTMNWDMYQSYKPDEDGIVPLYKYVGISDGLLQVICDYIKKQYGEDAYQENIGFIAQSLGQKNGESSEEAINRYLNEHYYDDHLKMYQKRPIYWMLSSGKQGAFKCLIYLHRYTKNTLATVNTKYFLPRTAMYKAERERLETRLASGQLDAREKKNVEAELKMIEKCEEELLEYGQVLDYLANQYIELDLDDGVKENYLKFQRIPLEVNGARVKKDLLVPFGLEKDKK